jgi:hypothetical protein
MSSGSSREWDDGSGDILDGEFGHPVIIDKYDMPKAILGATPPSQDGFPIKDDFATCFVEKYLTPCIAQDDN